MSRSLVQVLESMLVLVPNGERLRVALTHIRATALYQAPETMGLYWRRTAEALEHHFGPTPAPGWQTDVAEVFKGSPRREA